MRRPLRGESSFSDDLGLALGVVGLLALLVGSVLYAVVPELRGWALALLGASLASFIAFGVLGRRLLAEFLSTRQGRYGVNTLVMVLAFTVILVLANFLSSNVSARVDVTVTRQFTLAPQTKRVLQNLTEPVVAYGFFTPDDSAAAVAEGILREYVFASDDFRFEIVDPETEPAKAVRYQVDRYGIIVFVSGDRVTRTNDLTESAFTSALLRATGQGLKTVCFLSGHGERSVLGTTDLGMNLAAQAMEQELYVVRDFGFKSAGGVPEECSVVIVAGPDRDLEAADEEDEGSVDEGDLLRAYLGAGGNVLFLLTPDTPETWLAVLRDGNIDAGGGAVIDPASFAQPDRATPQIRPEGYLPDHPITDPLIERSMVTFFPVVTRVAPVPQDQQILGALLLPLIFTTDRSWLETEIDDLDDATYDQATDRRGPISIAVAAEFPVRAETGDLSTGRIVAIGNASFAGNRLFTSLGNGDLFLNSVNWLTEQESLISIHPKLDTPRLLVLTQRQVDWILYSSVGVLPLLVSLFGAWTWWRRR